MASPAAAAHGHDDHGEHHVMPLPTYFIVYGALLVLTIVTVLVSYAELPPAQSIPAAIAVATVKATLVGGWFMHLKYDTRFNVFIFLAAIWFMAVFFIFTFFDLGSRDFVHEVTGQNELRLDEAGE